MLGRKLFLIYTVLLIIFLTVGCITTEIDFEEKSHVDKTNQESGNIEIDIENVENDSVNQAIEKLNIGDRVVDYSWEWEFRSGEDFTYQEGDVTKPVIWIVVARDHYGIDSGITLLAEELIGIFAFDNSTDRGDQRSGSNHWGDSGTTNATRGLRPWLNSNGIHNGEGFYNAFSESFMKRIVITSVPNRDAKDGSFYTTEDKVFIPSILELGSTIHGKELDTGAVYPYFESSEDEDRIARLGGEEFFYWSRTPSARFYSFLIGVCPFGRQHPNQSAADMWYKAVRPALNIASQTPVSVNPNEEGIYEIGR